MHTTLLDRSAPTDLTPRPPRWQTRTRALASLWLVATALAGCGGGGGGGDTPAPAPAPVPAVTLTVQGVANYQSVPSSTTGALDYANTVSKPIRGATVELLNASNTVLATGTTSESGSYSLGPVSASGTLTVRVRAELKRSTSPTYDFTVRDNTQSGGLYALTSAGFTATEGNTTQNLLARSGWNGLSYTLGARAAAPFAILDTAYQATQKVLSVAPSTSFPALRFYWSVNNRPADGSWSAGEIGTTFFHTDGTNRSIFILGAANSDTDEYDSAVIAHEWGHYYQDVFSRDDSVGGSHGSADMLDMRVAFSEGWGNAFSGMVLGHPRYADSNGKDQGSGFVIDASIAPSAGDRGWYSENTVQHALWLFHQRSDIGFAPIHHAMVGGMKSTSILSSIHHMAAQLKAEAPSGSAYITTILSGLDVNSSDALGSAETNDGGVAAALPIYKSYTGGAQTYCTSSDAHQAGNGLGLFIYVRFSTVSAGTRTLSVAAQSPTSGTNPNLKLVRSDGAVRHALNATANSESLTDNLPAGTHTLVIHDDNQTSGGITGSRCFNLTLS